MSGGSLNYAYQHLRDAAAEIFLRATTPEEKALVTHLHEVATALHEVEWWYSCDSSQEDAIKAIRDLLPNEKIEAAK